MWGRWLTHCVVLLVHIMSLTLWGWSYPVALTESIIECGPECNMANVCFTAWQCYLVFQNGIMWLCCPVAWGGSVDQALWARVDLAQSPQWLSLMLWTGLSQSLLHLAVWTVALLYLYSDCSGGGEFDVTCGVYCLWSVSTQSFVRHEPLFSVSSL